MPKNAGVCQLGYASCATVRKGGYWVRLFLIDWLGLTPRSTSDCPLRGLLVLSHFSYSRCKSVLDVQPARSLTSESTSTNATNWSYGPTSTGEKVSSARLSALS